MESSDDEGQVVPEAITEYHFVDEKEEPVCFSILPLQWSEDESLDVHKGQVFLHGKTDDGLQKVYKQVIAWKVEIEGSRPVICILSKDKKWLKLLKPRKAYEDTIRKILITLECLHHLKRSPASSGRSMWEHVWKTLSHFEIRPSEDDLSDHLALIQIIVKRDETLSKSELLLNLLNDLPKKTGSNKRGIQNDHKIQTLDFINDGDVEVADNDDGNESEEDVECFDTVCAICDNGGELLCCEGDCLRSFHATKDTGVDSDCKTLGYSRAQVHAIQNFFCPNCVHKKQQCFACGKLGNSDRESGAEVFRCISASCGHFYHPRCVGKLLYPGNEAEAAALEKKIPAGESFLCPVHKCIVCGQFEDKEVEELQFAMCRRCPNSYHRKCLPREISFGDSDDEEFDQRAWDDLIPHRILIYCLKHEIDEDIGTPVRNHIIFPGIVESKRLPPTDSGKVKILAKRKAEDIFRGTDSKKLKKNQRVLPSIDASDRSVKKLKIPDASKRVLKDSTMKVSMLDKKKPSLAYETEPVKSVKKDVLSTKVGDITPSGKKQGSTVSLVDDEAKRRIMLLVKKSPSSSLTVEDLLEKKRLPITYAHCTRNVGKTITQGKVDGSIKAIRAALQKFEKGCSIEDAKAVCGPDILNQILSWKKKFRVYLSPFLHGVRYSSYGRHFTKVNKLEEIVERLHWYVQNGDMIVDFCCGANDFSLLMRKKLEATGKKCLFKNYDLFQPKNDFNFEKRDWMTVQPRELPTGSQLIMGLNPPFGVNAALANKFVDKALEFKPKLLILIVPKETERLDKKRVAYDLIWEDEQKLSGKSFYLPGSVDINDNQIEQWNVDPPLLYLWSRPDWTAKHKAIALKHGQVSNNFKEPHLEAEEISVHQLEGHNKHGSNSKVFSDVPKEKPSVTVGHEAKDALADIQPSSRKHENDVNRKDGPDIAGNSEREETQKPQVQSKKKSRKRKSKKQDEGPNKRTADNASDMSISPHQTDTQCGDTAFDVHSDGTPGLAGFTKPTQVFGMAYVGEQNGSLPRNDTDTSERRYSRDDVDNLERKYARGDVESLERRYGPSSWNGSFPSSSYDLLNNSTGKLSYESHYGINAPGYTRDSPLPSFEPTPYIGEDRHIRPDMHGSLRMYGQQEPNDTRSWHTEHGPSSVLAHTGPFSSSYGLSGSAIGASAMNRYAPRLDELNYVGLGRSMPNTMRRPGDNSVFEMPGSGPSFTPGSRNMFPGHKPPGGWLDE